MAARTFGPLLWRLLRMLGFANPFEAIYEIIRRQLEWQLAAQHRLFEELTALRARVEDLERLADGRRECG